MRPVAVTITIVCVPLGGTLAGVLGIQALPSVGWRALFVAGGVAPLAAAVAMRWLLPESPQFVRASAQPAGRLSIASLFGPEFRRDTAALWVSFFSCLLSVYLGFSWLTALLTGAGFDTATANTGITVFNLGGVAGALLGGVAITRFGSRLSMLTMTVVAVLGAGVLAVMPIAPSGATLPLIVMLTLLGAAINGVQVAMYVLAAHVYPTAIRATGVGTAVAFGRIGAVLTGYVGSWTIDLGGTTSYFSLMAFMMLVTLGALAAVNRHVPARHQLTRAA
jgi:AAHS family 4-hydroxybenzoate transporter-like MFS transporter